MPIKSLPLKDIRLDGGTQMRVEMNEATVSQYAEDAAAGVKFPWVVAFDDGENVWLSDGFHRFKGFEQAGLEEITCDVRLGTLRDAILFAAGANAAHGLRRTNEDKRKAVQALLNDEEWGKWPDAQIAKQCGVSQPFVSNLRRILKPLYDSDPAGKPERTVQRGGATYTMDTTNIGRKSGLCPRCQRVGKPSCEECRGREQKQQDREPGEDDKPDREAGRVANVPRDVLGYEIPPKLRDIFADRLLPEAIDVLKTTVSHVNANQALYGYVPLAEFTAQTKALIQILENALPYCVHQKCKGKGCKDCRASGYLSEWKSDELNQHAELEA